MGVVPSPVLQAWAPAAAGLLMGCVPTRASGVCVGCLSGVHCPGAVGVRAQEAVATVENSLNSH